VWKYLIAETIIQGKFDVKQQNIQTSEVQIMKKVKGQTEGKKKEKRVSNGRDDLEKPKVNRSAAEIKGDNNDDNSILEKHEVVEEERDPQEEKKMTKEKTEKSQKNCNPINFNMAEAMLNSDDDFGQLMGMNFLSMQRGSKRTNLLFKCLNDESTHVKLYAAIILANEIKAKVFWHLFISFPSNEKRLIDQVKGIYDELMSDDS